MYHVAIYQLTLHYGGPEEGGWWWTLSTLADYPVQYFTTKAEAITFAKMAWVWCEIFINPHGSDGYRSTAEHDTYGVRVERGHPKPHYPATRPHYE